MATTPGGTYYADATEQLSDWPATSENLALQIEDRIADLELLISGGGLALVTSQAFSAASAINVNGCFTSTFDDYLVIVDATNSASNPTLAMRMRGSSTDDSSSTYDQTASYSWNTIANHINGYGGTQQIAQYLGKAGGVFTSHMRISAPALAQFTRVINDSATEESSAGAVRIIAAGIHRTASPFDGFSLLLSAGTITGQLRIYGYQNT